MVSKEVMPLKSAIDHLKKALSLYRSSEEEDPLPFLTVSKAFEVAVEYGWRLLKSMVEDEGLDVPSPKAAVRAAAKLDIISDPQSWFDAIEGRNASVHDYFGISKSEFIKQAEKFTSLVDPLL